MSVEEFAGAQQVAEAGANVQRLRLEPGDKLVLTVSRHLSPAAMASLGEKCRKAFDSKVRLVVLPDDMSLTVVDEGAATSERVESA